MALLHSFDEWGEERFVEEVSGGQYSKLRRPEMFSLLAGRYSGRQSPVMESKGILCHGILFA